MKHNCIFKRFLLTTKKVYISQNQNKISKAFKMT